MFAEERRIKIVDRINEHRKMTVEELCDLFHVSSATIRTDLRQLHRAGLLTRTHGGAIQKTKTGFELSSRQKEVQHLQEKRSIAKAALFLIEDGDRVVLDTGTSTLELAKLLVERQNITVITNDLAIAGALEEQQGTEVILMGGILRKRFHCTIGIQDKETYSGLTVDKAFMGVNGLSLSKGATTPDLRQAETKRTQISIANRVILLCDSSKIGKVSFARFASIDQIDVVISDAIDKALQSAFEERGVEVVVAGS